MPTVGVGLGLTSSGFNGGLEVTDIVKNGPVARNGRVKRGDILKKVNGVAVDSSMKARELLLGEAGTPCSLTFLRLGAFGVADAIAIHVVREQPPYLNDAPGVQSTLEGGAQWFGALFRTAADTPPAAPPGSLHPAGELPSDALAHEWGGDDPTPSPGMFFSEFSFNRSQLHLQGLWNAANAGGVGSPDPTADTQPGRLPQDPWTAPHPTGGPRPLPSTAAERSAAERSSGEGGGGHVRAYDSERGYGAARVGPTGGAARSPGGTAQAGPTELELDLHQECERLRGLAFAARGESEAAGRRVAAMQGGVAGMECAWGEEKEVLKAELDQTALR
ncbi:hypothetical protein T484DRAFT_1764664 [Baffinella frigidus]|nr:hypothetical protein T484DRAFT_1764664 [Cryptophyta sp. CCMP2293]